MGAAGGQETAYEIEPELRGGTPRRVRYTGRTAALRRLAWCVAAAGGAALLYLSTREDDVAVWQVGWVLLVVFAVVCVGGIEASLRGGRDLLEGGVAVAGTITERSTSEGKSGPRHRLRYEFHYRGGTGFVHTGVGEAEVSRAFYDAHPPGASVTVLYRREDSSRNALYRTITCVAVEGAPGQRRGSSDRTV